jgi:hypothetical protein
MISQPRLADLLYELSADVSQLPQNAYARIHADDLWFDLWTNKNAYDKDYKAANEGWPIDGILSLGVLLERPILPERLVMFGWFDLLECTDLPTNSVHWPIVSSRVLAVFHELGMRLQVHQVRVLDRVQFGNVYSENVRSYEDDTIITKVRCRDDWFYAIQPQEFSVLSEDTDLTMLPRKVVWREDTRNPPALFTDPQSPGQLLVTQEARTALEKAGIRGVRFTEPFQ